MSLQVWLPLNGNLDNLGLANVTYVSGTPGYKTGKISSQSLNLNNRITFDCSKLANLKTFSVCFWGMAEDSSTLTTNWQDLLGFTDVSSNGTNGTFRWETTYASANGIHWHDNTTNAFVDGSVTHISQKGVWCHCCVVFDFEAGKVRSYSNGNFDREYDHRGGKFNSTGRFYLGETNNIEGRINDVRFYDHALSQQEIKELSKGLVLRYTLSDPYIESITNVLPQTKEYSINTNPAWDKTLNGDYMFTPTGWGSGYNGGVPNPTTGYHARWIIDDLHGQIISNNLISSLVAGGRTTVSNNQVTTSGEDKDTYFYLQLGSALQLGHIYKLSCDAENVPSGYYWSFPIGAQTNTSITFKIYNGYNEYYFIANSPCCQNAKVILDDNYRATVWQNQCIFKNFKLYEIKSTSDLVMHFNNRNSVINQKGRWLGISSNSLNLNTKGFTSGCKYTLTWEQKTNNLNSPAFGGLYYKLTSSSSTNFNDGYLYGYNTQLNTWQKMTKTFTMNSSYDATDATGWIYIYGHSSAEGDIYVRNVQLEVKDHASAYVEGGTTSPGGTVYDISGYANNGTSNGVTITPGGPKFNNSCKFNGSVNIITTSPCTEVRTLSIWVKWSSIPSGQSVVFLDGKSHLGLGLMSTGILCGTSGPGNYKTFSKSSLAANTWYHFVVVNPGDIAGVDRKLYINGVEQTPTGNVSNWTYGIDQTQIGKRSTTSDGFVGELSDVSLYATALSADDVYNLYRYNRL